MTTIRLLLLTVVLASLWLIVGALVFAVRDWFVDRPSDWQKARDALCGIFDGSRR